jgi:hypothetical protein
MVYGQDSIPPIINSTHDRVDAEISEDSVLRKSTPDYLPAESKFDSTRIINYWRITKLTGEMIPVVPDTFLTDYFNRTNVEGQGISVAHLGNLGLPSESRVFFERPERSEFMFLDPYWAYVKQPDNFHFTNTRIPRSTISYQTAGSRRNKEERLQALLSVNLNKKLNLGFNADYLYARGFYNYQGSKHLDWLFLGNYLDDRHQFHFFINPADYTNGENGGLKDDRWITNPEEMDSRNMQSKDFATQLTNTWNHLKGIRYYFNYHYNLGFEKETGQKDEEGNEISRFVPVSSIIYTFDYTSRSRQFYSSDSANLNAYYHNTDFLSPLRKDKMPSDSTSYTSLSNTLGLSLREGFSEWAKFDLTAFLSSDIRKFTLMDTTLASVPDTILFNSSKSGNLYSTYIGGELAKRTGKILRYHIQGKFGLPGYNMGDIDLSGIVETRIPFLNDTASISAKGHFKNIEPTYYEKHYHSQYFWWENNFDKVRKVFIGGEIDIPHTKTRFTLGVENVTNYIYFDESGYPKQNSGNIQVLAAGLEQKIHLGALHWDNQLVFQTSTDSKIIPLPAISAYSSLFVQFPIAKVLTIQMGVNAHYWTNYYSPIYEPATQQFRLQQELKVGEYPLINGFLNCHLKQTRFFLEYYNASPLFISPPRYFSIPHYPINPTVLKMGLSVDFHN